MNRTKCFMAEGDKPANYGPGAMYFASEEWVDGVIARTGPRRFHRGPDGKHLVVVLPNGDHWHVDSRASNCSRTEDNEHRCWVRHGEAPDITVDKNGDTCQAGAGSIVSGSWHGFLRNGYLEDC